MSDIAIRDIIQVKTLFFSNMVALEIISEEDEMVQKEFGDMEAVIQWKIGEIAAGYVEIKNSKSKLYMNAIHPNPIVTITFTDIQSAKDILNGKADATKLFLKGKILIEGDLKKGLKLMSVNELLNDYITFFKKLR